MKSEMLRLSMSPALRAPRVPLRLLAFAPALLASLFATSLFAAAPAAFGGERIIEIWNPPEARQPEARQPSGHSPEARQGAHLIGKTATPPHHRKVLAHRSASAPHQHQTAQQSLQQGSMQGSHQAANAAPNQAANESAHHTTAPAIDASRLKHNEVPPPKHDLSHFEDIPRIVTPEGNVLRVGTDGATAQVTR
jgi:hypothetical protein